MLHTQNMSSAFWGIAGIYCMYFRVYLAADSSQIKIIKIQHLLYSNLCGKDHGQDQTVLY